MKRRGYAVVNLNDRIREQSSSGGVFYGIASSFLERGYIIYGAAFDENMEVHHVAVYTKDELFKLMGSKYVQSSTDETFKEIKQKLIEGEKILFSGTPCQIAGLKSYLVKNYDNLFTVDFICHGVPSRLLWRKYLKLVTGNKHITRINFRDKSSGGV